jgi:DNA-binding winged helix-turn-helix (wHTH) protein
MQPLLSSTPRRLPPRGPAPVTAKAYIVSHDRALLAAARRIFVCAGVSVSVYKNLDEYFATTDASARRSGFTVLDARGNPLDKDARTRLAQLEGRGNRVLFVVSGDSDAALVPASFPTVRVTGDCAPLSAALQDWLAERTGPTVGNPSASSRRLRIDDAAHEVYVGELRLPLRPVEHALLRFFLERPHRLFSRADLLRLLWGEQAGIELRTVDVHVMRLRKALRPHGLERFVETVFGFGYRANPDVLDRAVGDGPVANVPVGDGSDADSFPSIDPRNER